MIQLISRERVFFKSSLVDHYISDLQKSWYEIHGYNLEGNIDEISLQAKDLYDHLEPFHNNKEKLDDFAVLAYVEKNRLDYITHRSVAFIRFFELIDIKRLYPIDELKCDWVQFPFKSFEKREAIKRIVNQLAYHEAFELDIDELIKILPLFHYSGRHSTPIIWFFLAGTEVTLAMFLCDDANFHTNFDSKDREKITSAASTAGLVMGGLQICQL